ncbi:hypothetical protein [Klebsiella pneumoniae]|uniref:hypothetical protein n=1 Tax=Klebsiella pneumoniae TaxID=573 RepID=UPI00216454EC|nr:hypothetical protein [Klebsiella pneumoniae]
MAASPRNVADIPEDLDWHFDGEKCPEGFLINSDLGDFNSEHGALFAQAALIAFDRNELIEFKIAFTCSNLKRPDGFGGAACVVSKDFIRWTGLHNFLEAERTAFAEKMNYFFCEFTEVVGELEYPVSFILRCPNSVNGKRAARTVLTGMCYSVGSATRQGSSSLTRFIGQSAMTSRT